LALTPQEINWKIEAWNDAKATKAIDDYALISLLRTGVASLFDKKSKFLTLKQFSPEADRKIETQQAKLRKEQDVKMRRQGACVGMRVP
jgi:hypothetical protein